jgi:hypothetical protein
MRALSGDRLLQLAVRLRGVQLGRPVELLLDRETLRAVGFDVLCRDDIHRFLPFPTATIGEDGILVRSPLVLLEEDELDFYRARALALSALRGCSVKRNGRALGVLQDIVVGSNGDVVEVIIGRDGRTDRIPFDLSLEFAPKSRTAA